MTNSDEGKEEFYFKLNYLIRLAPSEEKLIALGNFNACVGLDDSMWHGILGKHGINKMNSNGLLLLRTDAEHHRNIKNTIF